MELNVAIPKWQLINMRKLDHIVTRSVECIQMIVIFLSSAWLGNRNCFKQAYQAASLTTTHASVKT